VLNHGTGTDIAHFRLDKAAQVSRRPVDHAENRVKFVVELHHHAGAQLRCCNHEYELTPLRARQLVVRARNYLVYQ